MKDSPAKQFGNYSTRRRFLKSAALATAGGAIGLPAIHAGGKDFKRVIVLGLDAMDPKLTRKYVDKGLMPNCRRLMETGYYAPMGTTDPPQSPVAWSTFISGTNPGGHGIFDFVARKPGSFLPRLSTSEALPPEWTFKLSDWVIPIDGGEIRNLRRGSTLWEELAKAGIQSNVLRIPANFPPSDTKAYTMSGLGTPDIRGTYGIFSWYTSDPPAEGSEELKHQAVPGGDIHHVEPVNGVVNCTLHGPPNGFRREGGRVDIPFKVFVDPPRRLAKISIQEVELILKEGEWSPWVKLRFRMLGNLASASGICRFYLRQVKGGFSLYVSPVNIDPSDPALPISTPETYASDLASEIGPYYTQGMPEDTAALSAGALDDREFRQQAIYVFQERLRMFEHEFARFEKGLFYFYFSSLDLNSHAFWRFIDRDHPLYSDEAAKEHGDHLPWLYQQVDRVIGQAMARLDDETLLFAISDHGFTSFRRKFHLNSWLLENGYAALNDPYSQGETSLFENVTWQETRACGLGINSLYLNLRGRDPEGIVRPGDEAESLKRELIQGLESLEDPKTGERVVSKVYPREKIYTGPYAQDGPDLIVAYNRNYRSSKETILGGYPERLVEDNRDPWSGDHCMDSRYLSGVCLSNQPLKSAPSLEDMAPTILNALGAPVPENMTGRSLLNV